VRGGGSGEPSSSSPTNVAERRCNDEPATDGWAAVPVLPAPRCARPRVVANVIRFVTGGLGAGKSLYAMRKVGDALLRDRVVVTNVELREGWEHIVQRHNPWTWKLGRRGRAEYRAHLTRLYHWEPDLQAMTHCYVRGEGEGRAILVLDEAHNELSNREWQEANRMVFVKWLTQARKLGYHVYLISQHRDNAEAQIRRVATFEVRLTNWRQSARIPLLGFSPFPVPAFLALTFPANAPGGVIKAQDVFAREFFFLSWHRHLYDTFGTFYGIDVQNDPLAVWLPHREHRPVSAALTREAGAGPTQAPSDPSEAADRGTGRQH
jgi:Zonular occludens toxin (Zot)